jgi:hypothetical protein
MGKHIDRHSSVIGLRSWNSVKVQFFYECFCHMTIFVLYLQVFEYAEDLEYYWIDGYGYNITYRQACPPIKDMMQHFL